MKKRKCSLWLVRFALLAGCGGLFQAGCIRNFQREMDVLFSPAANPTLLNNSLIVDTLGYRFLKFWQTFW